MDHDPWHWDAGDVENFFRDHAANTLPENQRSSLPPPHEFFEALQSEGVSGDCLLTAIDTGALREEYGVRSAMTRRAIWNCICKLRTRSIGYATQHGAPILQTQTPRSLPPTNLPETPIQQALEPVIASVEEPLSEHRPGENTRSGEYQVQDIGGRKRRKLNLTKPESAAVASAKNYIPGPALSIDKLFYGDIGFGDEIGTLPAAGTITVLAADRDDELDDNDFQFQHQDKANGEVEFVHKQLKHMFRNAELVEMTRQGRDALAMLPYRQSQAATRSATVIQYTSGQADSPVAFKENVDYLNSTVPEKHAAAGGEWDFLTSKYAEEDDQLLPGYGDSETAASESKMTTEDSDADSMAEESLAPDELSVERAAEFIDEMIAKYATAWEARVESLEAKKAYTVWNKMKKSRTLRQELIASARAQIERLGSRLHKQRMWLLESQWQSEASLAKVCRSLQATVEDIEEQKWMVDVWGRKQEPWHQKSKKSHVRSGHNQQGRNNDTATRRLVVQENDRFSVSPPEAPEGNVFDQQEGDGLTGNFDNVYEADDEFHTPAPSPEPDLPSPDMELGAGETFDEDAQASTPFVVDDNLDEQVENVEGTPKPSSSGKNSPYKPHRDLAEADDLPSPSNVNSSRLKREPPPSTPSNRRIMSIDLTGGSPSSEAPTPAARKRGKLPTDESFASDANFADAQDIDGWLFSDLVSRGDRKRILLKIIRDAGATNREELHRSYLSLQTARFAQRVKEMLAQLQEEDPTGFDDDQGDPIRLAAGIYLRWHYPQLLTTATSADIPWSSAINEAQIRAFSTLLSELLRKKDTLKFNSPKHTSSAAPGSSSLNAIALSSSDNEMAKASQHTPHKKKRKREVERSQAAQGNRQKAFERMQKADLAESQSAANSSQLAAMINADPANSSVHINPMQDPEDYVYVPRKIATKMKEHQINGARFLWREITANDDDGGHGCVLAHTMGLGKTMQTIALLAAVNDAAQSKRKAVRSQLPKHLRPKEMRGARSLRVLILCPPGLVENWTREISAWVDTKLGQVYCLDSTVSPTNRLSMVSNWIRTGGPLIIGYDLFRTMANAGTGTDKPKKKSALSEEDAAELTTQLLQAPQIVVADEAHNLKNQKSAIAIAVTRFKTESKIALTGTPMSNDVQEVYALVSWVSPDYLGDPTEFRSVFAEPIKDGLYVESTRTEQRRSIMKLKVLHREIQPKVSRANIEALRGSIPPKVEFVIFVSLQELQKELYCRYIRAVKAFLDKDKKEDGTQKTSQVVFMSMLSLLTLLTGHPRSFMEKLLEPPKVKKTEAIQDGQGDGMDTESDAGGRTPSTTSGSATPVHPEFTTAEQLLDAEADKAIDAHVSALGLTPETVWQILGGDGSDIGPDPALSAKVTIFMSLLRSSLRAKDCVIVFTQRLSMLDYLEQLLKNQKILYGRIDGSNMSKRMTLLEQFADGQFSVMLVSTKAGGVGLNMQCANRVFLLDSGFNPVYEEQAIGRAYRLGQKKPVYVYRFVAAGTFETNIYNKQLFKTSLAQRVVDKKNPRRTAERNTREYLYEPKDVLQQDITEHINKDPEVLGKLLKQHGTGDGKFDTMIRDVKTMETLTEEIMDEPLDQEEQKVVEQETEARKQRPRGKRAAAMAGAPAGAMAAPSSTMGAPGYMPPAPAAPNMKMPPPSSTFAGPSNRPHPMGGLPMPRRT